MIMQSTDPGIHDLKGLERVAIVHPMLRTLESDAQPECVRPDSESDLNIPCPGNICRKSWHSA